MPEIAWVLIAVLVPSAVGGVLVVRKERRDPTSFTRRVDDLAWWGLLSADEQGEADSEALDVGERADAEARQDAAEAAGFLAHRVQANALFHP